MFDHDPFQLYNTAYFICRQPADNFSQFGKGAKFHIFHDTFQRTAILFWAIVYIAFFADRVFISGSTDAIGMQRVLAFRRVGVTCCTTHRKTAHNERFWPTLWKWVGLGASY